MSKRIDIDLALRGKDEGAEGLVDRVQQKLKLLRKEDRQSGQNLLEGLLRGGGTEIASKIADAFGAGIAVVGIEMGARALKGMAEEAAKLKVEMAAGKANAGDVVERLLAAAPVLGTIWQAGRAIREVLTGQNAALAAQEQYVKAIDAAQEFHLKHVEETRKLVREWADEIKKLRDEYAVLSLPKEARGEAQARIDAFNKLGELKKKYLLDSKQVDENGGKGEYTKTAEQLAIAQDRLKSATAAKQAIEKELLDQGRQMSGGRMKDGDWNYALGVASKSQLERMNSTGYGAAAAEVQRLTESMKVLVVQEKAAQTAWDNAYKPATEWGAAKIKEAIGDFLSNRAKAENEAADKVTQKRKEDQKTQEQLMRDARTDEQEMLKQSAAAQADLRVKDLEASGDTLGAELERLRDHYAQRLELAKSQAEREALLRSEALDESVLLNKDRAEKQKAWDAQFKDEAGDSGPGRRDPFHATLLNSRFQGIAERDKAAEQLAESKKQTGQLKKLDRLDGIFDVLTDMNRGRGGGIVLR